MAQENEQKIKVRNVWASNLITECDHVKDNVDSYSLVSIRGKYLLHDSTTHIVKKYIREEPIVVFDFLKVRIGNLPIIQLGITLSNSNQELPVIEGHPTIWLFHFNMSDTRCCPKRLCGASLDMLHLHGVDFERNQREGVDPAIFRDIMIQHGFWQKVSAWISFLILYDFGYMVKLLVDKNCYLDTLEEFLEKATPLLDKSWYDVKGMAEKLTDQTDSIEEAAEAIGVDRVAESEEGNAGFDSHLVMQMFMNLKTHPEFKDGVESVFVVI